MKKGFTLIELLAVIVLLGVLALVAVPAISNTLNSSKNKLTKTQEQQIIKGAKDYYSENISLLPNEGEIKTITIKKLQDEGYLPLNVKDIKKDDYYLETTKVKVTNEDGNLIFEIMK